MKAKWQAWKGDPAHPRDWDGPRGYMQLAIPGYDKRLTNFNRISTERALEQGQRLGKNITEEQLQAKAALVVSGHDSGDFGYDGLRDRLMANVGAVSSGVASSASASGPTPGMFGGAGLVGHAQEWLEKTSKHKAISDEIPDGEEEAAGEDDITAPTKNKFDKETARNRAYRQFHTHLDKLQASLKDVVDESGVALNEARASPERAKLENEIKVLASRLNALTLVLDNNVHNLQEHLQQFKVRPEEQSPAPGAASHTTDSRNMGELITAGPCVSWEKLITMDEFRAEAPAFKAIEDKESLDSKWEAVRQINAVFIGLKASILSAKNVLASICLN